MDLSISKGQVNDVTVLVNNTEVTVQQANNITVEVTPSATQYVAIDRGIQGATGTAATIAVGTTTTLSAGSSATVSNAGTSSAAVFNFGIPQGIKGDAGAGVIAGGTTGQVLSKTSNADYATAWTTPTTGTVTSVGGTAPISSTGGTTPNISITQATTSTNGYLTSTDWNTFNNKTSNTGTVTSVGLSAPTGLSVSGSPVTTSGTLALSYASGYSIPTDAEQAVWDTAIQDVTSTDGSVTVVHTGTTADLSVAVAGSTTNVIVQVRNNTGATLTKGTVVYMNGTVGQIPTVTKALATSDATSAQSLGMMSADLANNSNGYVTVIGLITNIDTSAYTDGEQLYLSSTTAGALTATKPYAPNHLVYVAVVEHSHPTQGKLFVKVQNGYEMDELHNVSAQTPSNGNTLIWNASTSLWEAHGLTAGSGVSVTNGAGSITVANTAPDQTVVMNSGTGISVTGTYPNFTVTNTSPSSGGTVTSVTATSPVASTGGTTPVISMPAATTSVNGYLTSTDWTTFNGKQASLVSGTNIKTINGSSVLGSGDLSVSASAGGSNTQVQYNSSGSLAGSANMTFNGTNFILANDAYINGVTVGQGGGASTTNTALGNGALSGNTGTSNTAVGANTLATSNQGNWNTAIGTSTLAYNSTGVSNVGMGRMALQNNISGSNNTAVGGGYYGILNSNTTGSWNTGIGDGALTRNSTAYYNTGIGGLSLNVITTSVGTFTITGGSGYTNGTYNNVQLTRVSGSTALTYPKVNITVSGGAVTAVTVASINWPDGGECFQDTTTVMTCSNTLIGGTGSGFSVTPATLLTPQNNSGFGYASGYRMYSGSNNTIAGVSAAYNLALGSNNAFYGYQAGYSTTSGSNSVAIGYQAAYTNTTSNVNTTIGYQAGYLATGSQCTSIGAQAGYRNTDTTYGNVFVGQSAGYGNTSGGGNVAIGLNSSYSNSTGSLNTSVGFQSLNSNSSGSQSTVLGYQAGYSTTGSGNQFFGTYSGFGVTTGANNVIVGSYQGSAAPISATGSNYVVLSDGAGNVRAYWNGADLTTNGNITATGNINNTRINPRVLASTANSATPTLNTDNYDMMVITGQSVAITSFTTNLTGTPVNGQKLWIAITGTGSIGITWGASFESSTVTLPSTTSGTSRLDIGFVWNVATSKWRCLAVA